MKLKKNDVGYIWPFPKKLIVEPRKQNGDLDAKRIGTEDIVVKASAVRTDKQLAELYFAETGKKGNCSGQQVADWLCDNGLVVRARI